MMRMLILFQHTSLARGNEMRNMRLCDMYVTELTYMMAVSTNIRWMLFSDSTYEQAF